MARHNISEDLNFKRHCCENTIRMFRLIVYFDQTFLNRSLIRTFVFPSIFSTTEITSRNFRRVRKLAKGGY